MDHANGGRKCMGQNRLRNFSTQFSVSGVSDLTVIEPRVISAESGMQGCRLTEPRSGGTLEQVSVVVQEGAH